MKTPNRVQNNILVNGTARYRSVAAAFVALNLPMTRHQSFRKKLKIEKVAEFEGYKFEMV